MSKRPTWIDRRMWYDPRFQLACWRERRRLNRAVQGTCSEGWCVELIDPKSGENIGGWGPVGCPCQDAEDEA